MLLTLIASWWILVQPYGAVDPMPNALGPYPSSEFCRISAAAIMPAERRFWTAAQREETEKIEKAEAERREKEIASAVHDKNGWIRLKNGERIHFNRKGEQDLSTSSGYTVFRYGNPARYTPLTGCVEIESNK